MISDSRYSKFGEPGRSAAAVGRGTTWLSQGVGSAAVGVNVVLKRSLSIMFRHCMDHYFLRSRQKSNTGSMSAPGRHLVHGARQSSLCTKHDEIDDVSTLNPVV